jgi:uracil-DNA glycosylase
MTTNLVLDSRQRAMLAEMGVRVWLPAPVVPQRKEPPLRLPVVSSPPMASDLGKAVRYVIANLPQSAEAFDLVLLGEPCTGEAKKLLDNILKSLCGRVFVAQMVTSENEAVSIHEQIASLQTARVVAFGPHACKAILDEASDTVRGMPFGKLRGMVHTLADGKTKAVVTYTPAQLVFKPITKAQTWTDLKLAMKELK